MFVYPIRDLKKLDRFKRYISAHYGYKHYAYICIGITIALSCGDMLRFTGDVLEAPDGTIRKRLIMKEEKAGKIREITFCDSALRTLIELRDQYPNDVYVFQTTGSNACRPWHESTVDAFIKTAGFAVGIDMPLGTHTRCKTFAHHAIVAKGHSLTKVQVLSAHSSPRKMSRKYSYQ